MHFGTDWPNHFGAEMIKSLLQVDYCTLRRPSARLPSLGFSGGAMSEAFCIPSILRLRVEIAVRRTT